MSQFTPNQKVKVRLTILGRRTYEHYCEHWLTPPLPLYRRDQWVIYTYGQLIEVFGEQPRPDGQEIFINNEILLDE